MDIEALWCLEEAVQYNKNLLTPLGGKRCGLWHYWPFDRHLGIAVLTACPGKHMGKITIPKPLVAEEISGLNVFCVNQPWAQRGRLTDTWL